MRTWAKYWPNSISDNVFVLFVHCDCLGHCIAGIAARTGVKAGNSGMESSEENLCVILELLNLF